MVARLEPETIAAAVNGAPALLPGLLAAIDPAVSAAAMNQAGGFLAAVLGTLDPSVMAGVVNANPAFLADILATLDPGIIGSAVRQNVEMLVAMLNDHVDDRQFTRLIDRVLDAGFSRVVLDGLFVFEGIPLLGTQEYQGSLRYTDAYYAGP